MSDPPAARDAAWVTAVARSRGVELEPGRAAEIAAQAAPILAAFSRVASGLAADDDPYAFRHLLAAEGRRG